MESQCLCDTHGCTTDRVTALVPAAVPAAPVTLHRFHQWHPKGCTTELQRDVEDDSISNDHLHAFLLSFCGAFLFFCYFLFNPLSQGMQRQAYYFWNAIYSTNGTFLPQFDTILLLTSTGMNLPHDPHLNLPLQTKSMLDHSISQGKKANKQS